MAMVAASNTEQTGIDRLQRPSSFRGKSAERPVLTVVVPAFNEKDSIAAILEKVITAPYEKQIIIVDDGSTDGTAEIIEKCQVKGTNAAVIQLIRHPVNRGKGASIRTGLAEARGDVILVQDADMEYDPEDYPQLVEPIRSEEAQVVYGSRYLGRKKPLPWTANRLCVNLLNLMVRLLYGQRITDEATCYKAFRADVLQRLDLRCERFEFCPEVTAKVCRMGVRIHEVPISYRPRTVDEGKKIGWRDGVMAIWTLLRWQFGRFQLTESLSNNNKTLKIDATQ